MQKSMRPGDADVPEPGGSAEEELGATPPVVEEDPVAVRMQRAEQLLAGGQPANAADAYAAVVQAHPDNVRALLGLAGALSAQNKFEAAEKELRRAVKLAPDSAEVHHQLGSTLYRRGVYAAAATALRRALELDPANGATYVILGEALNQMAESEQALEALENAVRIQPDSARAYYAMGIAYDRKGNPDRAAEMYRMSREVSAR